MTAHKYVEMITAKANDTELVVFCKDSPTDWFEYGRNGIYCPFYEEEEYFLCLPKHTKECLHWLNGGECSVSYESVKGVSGVITKNNTPREWTHNSLFMSHNATIKIKPKKEKRWIVLNQPGVDGSLYLSANDAKKRARALYRHDQWQVVEIEIEV